MNRFHHPRRGGPACPPCSDGPTHRSAPTIALALVLLAAPALAATKAIRAGKVIDPNGRAIANAIIVVTDDRIVSVGTGAPPAGTEVIDLSRYTVIPGMIDVHTHMTYYWDRAPGTRPLGQPRRPAGVTTWLAAENARRTLETGVTTIRLERPSVSETSAVGPVSTRFNSIGRWW